MVGVRFFTFDEEEVVLVVFDGPVDFDSSVGKHAIEDTAHCTAWLVGFGKEETLVIPPRFGYRYSSRILAN